MIEDATSKADPPAEMAVQSEEGTAQARRRAARLAWKARTGAVPRPLMANRLAAAARPRPEVEPPAEAETSKVVHIVRQLGESVEQTRQKRLRWPLISAVAIIGLPTLLAAIYYAIFAADIYVSEAGFAVRSNQPQAADVLGMVTGVPSGSVVSDSYIVADYVESREMIETLEKRLPLRAIYASENADFLTRLDPTVTLEELVEYWEDRVDVYFDSTKSTVSVQVQAFAPADAERVAKEIVSIVRQLINDLSAQSRRDAVQFASMEVARAELRVRGAREDMLAFRNEHKNFDPAQTATAALGNVAQLEVERSQLKSQLAAISGYLGDNAPSVQMLRSRIDALENEISRIQTEISESGTPAASTESGPLGSSNTLATVVSKYQELLLNQTFAETAYTAAMGSLERARAEADRSQSYLALYLHPSLAQDATYPRRLLNVVMIAILAAVLWAIGSLGALTIRDHMP